jgi:hypothetical protein
VILINGGDVAMAAVVFGTISGTIISITRMFLRRAESRDQARLGGGPGMEDRLQRLEQAVDAVAIEVERMSESQRFTSRILAERLPAPGHALPPSHT